MSSTHINGKLVKSVRCWKCRNRFLSNRSDAMFCSKRCRLEYYKSIYPRKRDIKCSDCSNHELCDLWKNFKRKRIQEDVCLFSKGTYKNDKRELRIEQEIEEWKEF